MYWHIETLFIGMAILLIIIGDSAGKLDRSRRRDNVFALCILLSFIAVGVDLADSVLSEIVDNRTVLTLVRTLYFAVVALPSLGWLGYAAAIAYESEPKKFKPVMLIGTIACCAYFILIVSNIWNGAVFYFDEAFGYRRGEYFFVTVLMFAGMTLFYYAVLYRRRRHLHGREVRTYLLLFPLIVWGGELLQIGIPGWLMSSPCYAIALLMAYLFIQNQKTQTVLAELTNAADSDQMTGMLNRAAAVRLVDAALTARPNSPCALLIVDIDDLKNINDTMGHPAGDAAILTVSGILKESFRSTDIVSRIGGDEFAVFLPDVGGKEALMRIVQKVISHFDTVNSLLGQHDGLPLHCSIGATLSVGGKSRTELYKQADTALYHAKRNGKNCFYIYTEDMGLISDAQSESGGA